MLRQLIEKINFTHVMIKTFLYALSFIKFQIQKNGFSVPGGQNLSEAQLDGYTRQYLQALVDNKLVVRCVYSYAKYPLKSRN